MLHFLKIKHNIMPSRARLQELFIENASVCLEISIGTEDFVN